MRSAYFQLFFALLSAGFLGYSSFYPEQFIQFGVDFTILIHQIPVVPYVFISMFLGIGSLDKRHASRVLYKLLLTLLCVWVVSLCVLFFIAFGFVSIQSLFVAQMPLGIPVLPGGAGYLTAHNWSLAFIPALIFLVLVGSMGLMQMEHKETVLAPLRVISEMIEYIFEGLLRMLPISLFFLLAHGVHLLTWDRLHQTGVYIFAAFLFCAFFVLWILPWALSVFAGLPMRVTLAEIMPCLWLSFLAGDCAVALPLMLRVLKVLLRPIENEHQPCLVSVLIPIAFAVPMVGSIGNLLFLFFSSMLHGMTFSWSQYALISLMGPLTMFSEPVISIPTMLSLLSMPEHLTPLYMLVSVMTDPFFDVAEAFSIIFICYIVTCSMYGRVSYAPKRVMRFLLPTIVLTIVLGMEFVHISKYMLSLS